MLFTPQERRFATAVSQIAYDNPFSPERVESERDALGDEFKDAGPSWVPGAGSLEAQQFHRERPNVIRLRDASWQTALALGGRLDGARSSLASGELALYEDLCL